MPVKVIKATAPLNSPSSPVENSNERFLRVAAYCRVSSDSDEQETSYEAQVNHYTAYITSHSGWTLAGIYADEGISGTQASKRPEFNRLIHDCEHGSIDLVITKSISRFARNTLDCLNYIRKLKALSIPIVFEKENINTMESSGEVLVTILASIAQQESASISANVRMGIEYGFQEGRGRVNYTAFLGYTGGEKPGSLVIVPAEADIVRRIYRRYLEGYSAQQIANQLTAEKVHTPAGAEKWYASTVRSILQNEKYCGQLLMQKYYTEDFLTHKVVRNDGQRPQYFVEDDHDPIVPKSIFYLVQGELRRRAGLYFDLSRMRFGERLALNGRLVCGACGARMKRFLPGRANRAVYWRCVNRALKKEGARDRCGGRIVREEDVKATVVQAFNRLAERIPGLEEEARVIQAELARLDEAIRDSPKHGGSGDSEEARRDALLETRAARAYHLMQIRFLIEVFRPESDVLQVGEVEQPEEHRSRKCSKKRSRAACVDEADFYRRTAYRPAEGVIADGRVVRYDDGLVTRFEEKFVVGSEGLRVVFKAGVEIEV